LDRLEGGRFVEAYYPRIEHVQFRKDAKFTTLRGRFVVSMKSASTKNDLIQKYSKEKKFEHKGFFAALPWDERERVPPKTK